jgi:hypothetical protein
LVISSYMATTALSSPMSAWCANERPPAVRIRATTDSAACASCAKLTHTMYPAAAAAMAMASPRPRLPPVTSIVLPSIMQRLPGAGRLQYSDRVRRGVD